LPLKNSILYLILLYILFISQHCNRSQVEAVKERRMISLSPFITEIIYALKQEEDLIAVSDFCSFPPEARNKVKIGGLLDPNIEKMIALNPTLILGQPAHDRLKQELKKLGLNIIMVSNEDVSDIYKAIDTLGFYLNCSLRATQLIAAIQDSLRQICAGIQKKDSVTAMLIVGREAGSLRNITVAGRNTFIGEMWELAGGKNLYSDLTSRYSLVSLESILIRNPDLIIEFDPAGERMVKREVITEEWEIVKQVRAIKKGNLFLVSGEHIFIPGPRFYLLAQDFTKLKEMAR
jgi:iron complex transport system substrate-binding protein